MEILCLPLDRLELPFDVVIGAEPGIIILKSGRGGMGAMAVKEKLVHIQYFAILREARGQAEEDIRTTAETVQEFYEELKEKFGFKISADLLRVSINDEFCSWQAKLKEGDRVVFIPPVAGG